MHAPPPCPPTIPLLSTGPSIALPTLCLPLSTLDPPDKVRGRGSDQQAQRGRRRSRGTSPPHHTSCSPPTTPRLALSAPLHTAQPCTPRTQRPPLIHDLPDRAPCPSTAHTSLACVLDADALWRRCVRRVGCPCRARAARQVPPPCPANRTHAPRTTPGAPAYKCAPSFSVSLLLFSQGAWHVSRRPLRACVFARPRAANAPRPVYCPFHPAMLFREAPPRTGAFW